MSDLRLSDVLARRGVLAAPEVVTLVVALALDLADMHAAGDVHGAVCAEAVRFDPDGRPRLCRGTGVGEPGTDVRGVAAIGHLASGDRSLPPGLVEALQAGLDKRCDARELAEAVLASGPAAPLRLPWPQHRREITGMEPGVSTSSKRLRPLMLVALVVVPVALMLLRRDIASPTRWTAVLDHLDAARLTAVADRDVGDLSAVYDPASPLRSRDMSLIHELISRGLTIRGQLPELTNPQMLTHSGRDVALSVVERPASYVLTDARGRVVARVRGLRRRLVVHVRRVRDGWRIVSVD